MKNTEQKSNFIENYYGILTHDGSVKVAKPKITGEIQTINKKQAIVKNKQGNHIICDIHKKIQSLMRYAHKGDLALINLRKNKSWIEKKKKKTADNKHTEQSNDFPVSENSKWIDFKE